MPLVIRDRPRYQAGQPVLFTARMQPPGQAGAAATVNVQLRDPAGRDLAALTLQPDPQGVINGSFPLAADTPPGLYRLEFAWAGHTDHESLLVDPAPPAASGATLQIAVLTPLAPIYAGDLVTATLRASYGPVRPAAGLTVTLSLLPPGVEGPGSGVEDSGAEGVVVTGTTDADGLARLALRVPVGSGQQAGSGKEESADASPNSTRDPRSATSVTQHAARSTQDFARLLAQASDGAGQAATAQAGIAVRAGRLYLDQQLPGQAFSPGTGAVITLTVRDEAGRPLADQMVTSGLFAPSLPGPGSADPVTALLGSVTARTNAAGVATATLALPLQGAFRIQSQVTDTAGVPVNAAAPIWVYAPGSKALWAMPILPPGGVALTADQANYGPGESARLLIQAGEPGGGLVVTALDGHIQAVQGVRFAAGGGVATIAVPTETGSATTLDVAFLRFAADADGPRLVTQTLRLPLRPPTDLRLELGLPTPPADGYLPGAEVPVRLALTGAGKAPPGGEVLIRLAAADGATRAWISGLVLDGSGQVSTTLRLPDEGGQWTLDAWAFTARGLRHSTALLRTGVRVEIAWSAPATLVQGDQTTVLARITNQQADPVSASLRLGIGGVLARLTPEEQGILLAPGESRLASWIIRADSAGTARLMLDATWNTPGGPDMTTHREAPLTVQPYGLIAEQVHAGTVSDSRTITLTLPSDVEAATARLDVRVAPILAGALVEAATALAPPAAEGDRGPLADVAARILATTAVGTLYQDPKRDPDDLPATLAADTALDLQYLYNHQQPNGAWISAPGAPTDLATSLAVLEALWHLEHDGGTLVDRATTQRALAWVHHAVLNPAPPGAAPDLAPSGPTAEESAAALYILSLYGQAAPVEIDRLLAAEPRLSAHARAFLALTLRQAGRDAEARLVVERLAVGAVTDPPDARVLDALLWADRAGAHGPVADLTNRLLDARLGAAWADAPATAVAVLALSHYAPVLPEPAAAGYRVLVNGRIIYEAPAGGVPSGPRDQASRVTLLVPGSELHTGENRVRFETGDARLYYSLRVQALIATGEHPIASREAPGAPLALLRVYEARPATATTAVLTITVTAPGPEGTPPLRLDDPLPAGLARLPGLTFGRVGGPAEAPVLLDARNAIQAVADLPGAPGLRLWLAPLAPGTYVLTYPAAPLAAGSYTALPALLQAPGDPTLWARSGGGPLLIDR